MSAFPQYLFSERDLLDCFRTIDYRCSIRASAGAVTRRGAGSETSESHAAAAAVQVASKCAMLEQDYKETTRRTAAAQRSAHRAPLVRPCVRAPACCWLDERLCDWLVRQGTSRWEARRPIASRVSLASPPPLSPGWVSEMPSGNVFPRDRVRCAVTPSLCAAACTPVYVLGTSDLLTLACGPKPAATNEAERSGQATPTS